MLPSSVAQASSTRCASSSVSISETILPSLSSTSRRTITFAFPASWLPTPGAVDKDKATAIADLLGYDADANGAIAFSRQPDAEFVRARSSAGLATTATRYTRRLTTFSGHSPRNDFEPLRKVGLRA
jgi:hypothetical protein